MSREIIIRAEAEEEELNNTVLWYEQQRKGLGNYFLIHISLLPG